MSRPLFFRLVRFSRCDRSSRRGARGLLRGGAAALWVVASVVAVSGAARADEFSPVPAGDPIYRQLRALAPGENAGAADASLTRYEAALQAARVITRVTNDPRADLSRAGWRALRDLTVSLQIELRQLGIDIAGARALAERNAQTPASSDAAVKSVDFGSTPLAKTPFANLREAATPRGPNRRGAGLGLNSDDLSATNLLQAGVQSQAFRASIMPRLRVGAALQALQRAQDDPFNTSTDQTLLAPNNARLLRSDVALDYDVNSWLSVRAQSSRRSLLTPDALFASGDFYSGATEARSTGGGVAVALGLLKFRTDIESLSTDTGARGTSIGGGVGLSAWQNRLSLSAHLARLQPEDRAVLQQTRTELNIGLAVTNHLDLSLRYQGLFTPRNDGSERVMGGLNLSF